MNLKKHMVCIFSISYQLIGMEIDFSKQKSLMIYEIEFLRNFYREKLSENKHFLQYKLLQAHIKQEAKIKKRLSKNFFYIQDLFIRSVWLGWDQRSQEDKENSLPVESNKQKFNAIIKEIVQKNVKK
jgi:hypothetical protein